MKHISHLAKAMVFFWAWAWAAAVPGIQTHEVELGYSSVYDGQVHIRRNAEGQMVFQDAETPSPVALSALNRGVSAHEDLTGLSADDHLQYLTDARHLNRHSQDFNSSMTIPLDAGGNSRLGDHVTDSDIHLSRHETAAITGDWRFIGTPAIWNGLSFSAGGAAGDVLLRFAAGAQDARILWSQAANRFLLNRGIETEGDAVFHGNASVKGRIYGVISRPRRQAEILHLPMDDDASNPAILDATGFYSQTLQGPENPTTQERTTSGVVGAALNFMPGDYVALGTVADPFLSAHQSFSIAFWWKTDNLDAATTKHVVSNYTPAQSQCFYWFTYNGNMRLTVFPENGNWLSYQWTAGDDGLWHHYVLVRDGATITVWRDGVLKSSDTNAANVGNLATGNLYIARSDAGGYSAGDMDDFRLYGGPLSEAEIAALYNAGAGTASSARFVSEVDGGLSVSKLFVDGGLTEPSAVLQISEGAYCDGNTWVNVSSRSAKTDVRPVSAASEWERLDQVQVVEFSYKKRNPNRGGWLDPAGQPVEAGTEVYRRLIAPETPLVLQNLLAAGYAPDERKYTETAEAGRRLGFMAEDLATADARLSRGGGVAALDVAAFNLAALQEAKRRIEELEARLRALERAP